MADYQAHSDSKPKGQSDLWAAKQPIAFKTPATPVVTDGLQFSLSLPPSRNPRILGSEQPRREEIRPCYWRESEKRHREGEKEDINLNCEMYSTAIRGRQMRGAGGGRRRTRDNTDGMNYHILLKDEPVLSTTNPGWLFMIWLNLTSHCLSCSEPVHVNEANELFIISNVFRTLCKLKWRLTWKKHLEIISNYWSHTM